MSKKPPIPRFTVITLGVTDMRASIAFYEALGFTRKMRATGEAVAFFDTGGTVLALFPWDQLASDATLPDRPRPKTFRGSTLA
jgi:catechol 2,3-dioxygenase-like lactoylglutathione lyase family enzyme